MSDSTSAGHLDEQMANSDRRRQLERLLAHDTSSRKPRGTVTIPRRGPLDTCALSFNQEMIWLTDQLVPGSSTYNVPRAFRLRGPLEIAALRRALDTVVERHQALRTTFVAPNGRAMQIVGPARPVDLSVIDLSAVPPEEQGAEAQRCFRDETCRPFDLGRDLMLRATLVRLSDEEHLFLIVMHHIASDAWSLGILMRELGALYAAYREGRPSPLPELPIQYADFALWQREQPQGEGFAASLSYWRQQLEGASFTLDLPLDHPRPSVQSFRGDSVNVAIPRDLSNALGVFSREEKATPFMTLTAVLGALLHRYCGQDDVIIGTPIAGRQHTELEGLIGFFVNTLVLRIDLSGNPSFRELLGRVREVALGSYAHQELPFAKLVMELQPERDMSRSPLFQTMLVLYNTPARDYEFPGLTVTDADLEIITEKFDLTLTLTHRPEGFSGGLRYATDLFDAGTIARMNRHLQTLVAGVLENREQRLSHLPLLGAEERRQILVGWNQAPSDYPRDRCVHQLFELQAQQRPDAVAVSYRGHPLTYRDLNARANRLAHYLRRRGVREGDRVALCMERSLEMVIATLGILKAGAAYVPLDPAYPRERLAFMLADAGAKVLLTQVELEETLAGQAVERICLDREWETIAAESDTNPPCALAADALAYVMYTSGSTGTPKGVAIPHRGIVRLVTAPDYVRLGPDETLLQLAPISFDAATFELWGALLHGSRCVLYPDRVPTPEDLGEVLRREGITTLWLTASLFNLVVDQAPEALRGVKQLLTGGEAMSVAHARRALEHLPETRLINAYGPTEATTFATAYTVPRPIPPDAHSVPIGRPIPGTQVYLLDRNLQPVPPGVTGELYIGGDGLAHGYLNRPDLTAERFVPWRMADGENSDRQAAAGSDSEAGRLTPPATSPSELSTRLYRTGDLARYLPDGNIDFLGRTDNQVKIRGLRIELGEIEAALCRHPDVRDVVVLAREDKPGDKRLVAYIIAQTPVLPSSLSPAGLRAFLKESLPDYMVPAAFVVLEAFPLTPSGKVDRKGLPQPQWGAGEAEEVEEEQAGPIEAEILAIWAQVLGVERLSLRDDFFSLGGHSLLATQVISRVRDVFQVNMPLRDLFERPTAAGFAELVTDRLLERVPEDELARMLAELAGMEEQ